jgi:hypothetical protein
LLRFSVSVLFPKEVKLKPPLLALGSPTKDPKQQKKPDFYYIPNISRAVQDEVAFYNPNLNDRQKAAVIQILLAQGRPVPYVIFGPPGLSEMFI